MKTIEHLTKEQLAAYAADSLAPSETNAVGKHLLQCAACRDSLPAPTPEQFWSALLVDEPERKESFASEKTSPATPPLSTVLSFFRRPALMGAGALIIVVSFSFLIWQSASKRPNPETEAAQTMEAPKTENNFPISEKSPVVIGDGNLRADVRENPSSGITKSLPSVANNNQGSDNTGGVMSDPTTATDVERKSGIETRRPARKNTVPAFDTNLNNENSDSERSFSENKNVLRFPPALNRVIRRELLTLKGSTAETDFNLITPVGTFIKNDSPTFVWEKAPGAVKYEIAVRSVKGSNTILNESTSATSYKVSNNFLDQHRGQVLQWSVTAYAPDGISRSAPSGSEPEALFLILDREKTAEVEKRFSRARQNSLAGAVILANAGLLDDAENELKNYLISRPRSKQAWTLLKQIRSRRNAKEQTNSPSR